MTKYFKIKSYMRTIKYVVISGNKVTSSKRLKILLNKVQQNTQRKRILLKMFTRTDAKLTFWIQILTTAPKMSFSGAKIFAKVMIFA